MRFLAPVLAVLAVLALVGALHPSGISFDGLAFLMGVHEGGIDYGHALYAPLLRAALGLAGSGAAPDGVARGVSALGAALAFALLWRRVERGGASRLAAGLVAACFALSTLVWQEAGSIEPTSWTLAALLAAAEAAEHYGRRPGLARLALALLAFGFALGFHLVSVCALPWLVRLALSQGARPPRAHLALPLGAGLLLASLAFAGGRWGVYWSYWSGFVPDLGGPDGAGAVLGRHFARGARLCAQGAPVLLGGLALAALARPTRRAWREGAWLGVPYLLAFACFGKPLVGLLVPVFLAAALTLGRLAAAQQGTSRARAFRIGLALAAALQLGLSLRQALEWHRAPDQARADAALLVRHLPPGVPLFAGELANHVRYYAPEIEVVSLPELWHGAYVAARDADPIALVRQAVSARGTTCALSTDGVAFLFGLQADPARLGLTPESALWLPEDPRLALFPLEP